MSTFWDYLVLLFWEVPWPSRLLLLQFFIFYQCLNSFFEKLYCWCRELRNGQRFLAFHLGHKIFGRKKSAAGLQKFTKKCLFSIQLQWIFRTCWWRQLNFFFRHEEWSCWHESVFFVVICWKYLFVEMLRLLRFYDSGWRIDHNASQEKLRL